VDERGRDSKGPFGLDDGAQNTIGVAGAALALCAVLWPDELCGDGGRWHPARCATYLYCW